MVKASILLLLIFFYFGCAGETKVWPHPGDSIVKIQKCAKERGITFSKTAGDILYELNKAKQDGIIKSVDQACVGVDNLTVRSFLLCLRDGCLASPKDTSPATLLDSLAKKDCLKHYEKYQAIKSPDCVAWKNKLASLVTIVINI
jgi:hypothetical protein